jgi:hypothetical protein
VPESHYTLTGDELHWPFEAACLYVIHRSIAKVCTASPLLSQPNWSPEDREAFRSLCRALEAETVRSIDNFGAVHLSRWSNAEQALNDFETRPDWMSFERFIAKIERVTRDVRVRVADLLKVFPAPGETKGNPAPGETKKPPALSDMIAFCSNHAGVRRTAPEMDAALKDRFGPLDRETLRAVRKKAGFKGGPKGRPKGLKNKPVKGPKRSK